MEKATAQLYLVSKALAERTGFMNQRYVTKDGRFIVDDRDLRVARLTADEQKQAEPITKEQAKALISANGYKTGNSLKTK